MPPFAAAAERAARTSCTSVLRLHAQFYTDCVNPSEISCQKGQETDELPPATPRARAPKSLPAVRPRLQRQAVREDGGSEADVINIDLEDSVAPDDKDKARANTIQAINDIDWGNKTLSVRINGLDTGWWYRDVVDLLEKGGERLDQIMIPKAGCAADIYAVDALVTGVERAQGRQKRSISR